MKKQIITAIGVALIVIITVTLYRLGIFKTVEVLETTSTSKVVYGKYFEGNPKSESFKQIFQEIGKIQESNEVKGKVCGVYLNNPEDNKGVIKAFIGVWVSDSSRTKKEGYSYYFVPEREVIQGHLNADFRVATFKCYSAIFEYSEDKEIKITNQFFEWFENSEEVFVEVLRK